MVHDVSDTKLDSDWPPTPALLLSAEMLLCRSCEAMPFCMLDELVGSTVTAVPVAGRGRVSFCSVSDAAGAACMGAGSDVSACACDGGSAISATALVLADAAGNAGA